MLRNPVPLIAISPLLLLAACVGPSQPPPAPEPAPSAPVPAPLPAPPPAPNWADRIPTPGNWTYAREAGGSVARHGSQFAIRCVSGGRQIALERSGVASASAMMIRTTSATRALPARVQGGNIVSMLPARDPLLDAIGFSRGRFAVEVAGMPGLILPTWAEVQRVVEDCRR